MGADVKIFEKGNLTKVLFKFAFPAVISLLIIELYAVVDTVFVGRYVGATAIAALTVNYPIIALITALGFFIGTGGSTYVSRSAGEKDNASVRKIIVSSIILVTLIVSIIALIVYIFMDNILFALGATNATLDMAKSYMMIALIGSLFEAITTVISYIMMSLGNSKIILKSNIVGAVLNVILNYILIAVFNFGIVGAALSTVVSKFIGFIYTSYKFIEVKKYFKLKMKDVLTSMNTKIVKTIIMIGLPTLVIELADPLTGTLLNNILVKGGGEAALVIFGVVTKVSLFMYITLEGISSSMQPIAAYNYGANNKERVRETVKITIKWVVISIIGLWIIFTIFANPIMSFFIEDKALTKSAVDAFRISILCIPIASISYIAIYYYQAISEMKKGLILSLLKIILLFLPFAIILGNIFGPMGVWVSYPISDFLAGVFNIYLIKTKIFKKPQTKVVTKNRNSKTHKDIEIKGRLLTSN